MDSKEKETRMSLLQELMDEMDKNVIRPKTGGKEPVAQVTEVKSKEVPLSELKDVMKEKMGSVEGSPEEEAGEPAGEESMEGADQEHEDEEDAEISDFVKKIRAIQASKKDAGK
jgi:hypothetical protein